MDGTSRRTARAQPGRRTLPALVVLVLCLPGCFTFQHTVGAGPVSTQHETETQWYAFWGLSPLGDVDTHAMARGSADYRITTEFTCTDVLISAFTSLLSFYCQTVTVER